MQLIKLLKPLFQSTEIANMVIDKTLYRIVTHTNEYCGHIVHQDNMVIKLQSKQGKPVKILKKNIKSIEIL
jgi:hypothetical protein